MMVRAQSKLRGALQSRRNKSLLITAGVAVAVLLLVGIPLMLRMGFTFAASPAVTKTMVMDGHQLTIHMQQVGNMNNVSVNDIAPQGSQTPGGVFNFAYDTSTQMLYNTIQTAGSTSSVNFAVNLSPSALSNRQTMIQQVQTQQVQQMQGLNTGVAQAQAAPAQAQTDTDSLGPISLGDGFSFVPQDVTGGQQVPGFTWMVHVGGTQLSTVEGANTSGDLKTFQSTIVNIKNSMATALGSVGASLAGVIVGIVTSETGVGAVVGAVLAAGAAINAIGQIVSIFNMHQALKATFARLQGEAIPVPQMTNAGNGNGAMGNGNGNGTTGANGNGNGAMGNGNGNGTTGANGNGGYNLGNNGGIIMPGQQAPAQGPVLCPICG